MILNRMSLSVAEYSTAQSINSVKTSANIAILKKELNSMSDQTTGSDATKTTLDDLAKTLAASPLGNSVDICI